MKTLTAAIQFGSSRICAAAAKIHENGTYEVTGIETVSSAGCIQHGCVTNIEETAVRIKGLMQKLSNRVKSAGMGNLDAAYIGLCGISMHSMEYQPSTMVGEDMKITDEVLGQLESQSMNLKVADYDILGLKSNGQTLEGQQALAYHQLILAEHRLKQGFLSAMERANIRVAGILATPLLLGDILSAEEKQKGCLLLDLGAHLTTLSIYKDNALKFLTVLPLGCDSVTLDIATLGMRLEEAEDMKVNWSDASNPSEAAQGIGVVTCPVDQKELNLIVTSRYEEIAANIAHQVEKAGYKGLLEGGCILTGGASVQKGLTTLLSRRLEIGRISTRSCNNIRFASSERKPYLASLMSMLSYCTESCETKQKEETIIDMSEKRTFSDASSVVRKKTSSGIRDFFGDLFSGLDE